MLNKVTLIGNVGADPEVRSLEGGVKVARLRVATTERIYNRQTQESKDHTEWHTVVLWRNLADVADRFLRKGSQIYVEGAIRSNEWTDQSGNKRFGIEIVGNELKMLGRRQDNAGGQEGGGQAWTPRPAVAAPAAAPAAPAVPVAAAPAAAAPADDPDDLPF